MLDPQQDGNYGSQPLIGCIDDAENHNSHPLVIHFDASSKGAYGRGGAWLMLSGGGCALVVEADAIWKTTKESKRGIPLKFSIPKSNRINTFFDGHRNC